jgi:hypothetical protein
MVATIIPESVRAELAQTAARNACDPRHQLHGSEVREQLQQVFPYLVILFPDSPVLYEYTRDENKKRADTHGAYARAKAMELRKHSWLKSDPCLAWANFGEGFIVVCTGVPRALGKQVAELVCNILNTSLDD